MHAYVVEHGEKYEGGHVSGVYLALDLAIKGVEEYLAEEAAHDAKWNHETKPWEVQDNHDGRSWSRGHRYITVTRWPVTLY